MGRWVRATATELALVIVCGAGLAPPLVAQSMPPAPVGFTAARQHSVRSSVQLTGSVEARQASVVASEVAGLVVELAAREGDAVAKGQALVRLRRQALDLARQRMAADLTEAEARLALAESNLARSEELFASQVIARQQLDDASSESAAWHGRVESLKAQLARVEDDLQRSTVAAPFAGVVVRELIQVGEWLAVGDEVAELVGLDDLEVELEVPERYFGSLRQGATAQVSFEALPDLAVEGRVSAVVPVADRQARTFPVKVRVPNPDRRIGVGMLARVSLASGEPVAATVVPKDAVVRRGAGDIVYRIDAEDKVEPVEVETGTSVGAWTEVRGPISPGDRVITRGNERLFPGQAVQARPVEYELP